MDGESWILVRRGGAATGRGKLEPCSREEELQNAEDVALARGPCVLPPRDPLLEQRPGVAGFEDERRLALGRAPLDALDPVAGPSETCVLLAVR